MKTTLAIALAVAALVAASATTTTASATATDDGGRIVQLVEQLAAKVQGDRGRCAAFAADVQSFITAHKAQFEAFHRLTAHWSKVQRAEWAAKYRTRLTTAMQQISQVGVACANDANAKAALLALGQATK